MWRAVAAVGQRRAGAQKRLVVIDEFPELFGARKHPDSELMAVLEEVWGTTQTKVLLCGSQIGTMKNILSSRAPLHGRVRPLQLQPISFHVAREFLSAYQSTELVDRYAIAGGMPRYLNLLNRSGSFKSLICNLLLNQNGTLFQEPRTVLEMELTETGIYFSLLEALAKKKEMEWGDLVNKSGVDSGTASKYMRVLQDLGIVERTAAAFAPQGRGRRHRYRVRDPLTRFWFRFVFPFQDALGSDLSPEAHYARNVEPYLRGEVDQRADAEVGPGRSAYVQDPRAAAGEDRCGANGDHPDLEVRLHAGPGDRGSRFGSEAGGAGGGRGPSCQRVVYFLAA